MRLRDVFVELLKERGIERIWGVSKDIQRLAVLVANGKASVCKAKSERSMDLKGNVLELPAQAYIGKCNEPILDRNELISRCAHFPYVVVDCSFLPLHSEKEKKKLFLQLKCTLGVIREFMWDERFVITGAKFDLNVPYYSSLEEFLREKDFERIILLDPNARDIFNGEKADCYIIGGIVDLAGNKRGLTTEIGKKLEKARISFEAKKIVLRGDTIGVPDRINSITEILLRCVLDGEGIEDAIKAVQSPLVARWRLKKEIPRLSIRIDTIRPFRIVRKSDFYRFNWLNVCWKDFFEVCRQLGFIVVEDRVAESLIRSFQSCKESDVQHGQ